MAFTAFELIVVLVLFVIIFLQVVLIFRQKDGQNNDIGYELKANRDELNTTLKNQLQLYGTTMQQGLKAVSDEQTKYLSVFVKQIESLSQTHTLNSEKLKDTVSNQLEQLQKSNEQHLDKMRHTVDEKLQGTLEKRLEQSFNLIGERLEQVHRGLGEMQTLAIGVGDLKKILSNVKSRGTWGEIQLGAMLEQVLNNEQYQANVSPKNNSERVEFAVKIPSKQGKDFIWLPIDAKFPIESYYRLLQAQDDNDAIATETALKEIEKNIKNSAKDIATKYIYPPKSTDFAILYLPIEGLFSEITKRQGLVDFVQREYRVVFAGPTTLWAILNSLQMGFRTLAIEQRTSEVWQLLSSIKTEWSKYGDALDKVKKKLEEASNSIDNAQVRTRAVEKKLKKIEQFPDDVVSEILDRDDE